MHPCDICGKTSHVWFNCPLRDTKPKDWKPERLSQHPAAKIMAGLQEALDVAKGNAEPYAVHKRGPGRPKTITDMAAYKAQKQREYRARSKASKPIQ